MQIQKTITELLQQALKSADVALGDAEIVLEHPADLTHGDYSCNIAMRLAKVVGKKPRELAEEIVKSLPESEYIGKAEVAGPGFINFYLSASFFGESIGQAIEGGDNFGRVDSLKDKKVMVEYTDPNPFKELHIGHMVPNSIGVALARTAGFAGADVREVTFQGDVGMHVAKSLYGMLQLGLTVDDDFTAQDLGKAYAVGSKAFEDEKNPEAQEEIKDLNKRIYQIYSGEETELKGLYEKGKQVSVSYFEEVYKILNSDFKHYFFESITGQVGEEIVRAHIGDVFEESNGAVIFKGEEYGLHTRVFINAQGLPTYESKDIGLIKLKHDWWPHDTSITVTGGEQEEYFKVMHKAMSLIDVELADTMALVVNGMLELKNGKMSSRTGDVVRALDLIDDVKKIVQKKMQDADEVSIQQVAIGAIKYSILKSGTSKDIKFDFDTSLSFEGDSGPYLQYTYARCKSVLAKAHPSRGKAKVQIPQDWETTNIEKLLYRFPEVVERAALEYEPHYIANYLNDLASTYNSWYAQGKILDGSDAEHYKLALTEAAAHTIKNGLYLLGIETPEKM